MWLLQPGIISFSSTPCFIGADQGFWYNIHDKESPVLNKSETLCSALHWCDIWDVHVLGRVQHYFSARFLFLTRNRLIQLGYTAFDLARDSLSCNSFANMLNCLPCREIWRQTQMVKSLTFAPIATTHRYCASKFTRHVMHRARAPSNKIKNNFAWI